MKKNLSHWNNNIDYPKFQQKKDENPHPSSNLILLFVC